MNESKVISFRLDPYFEEKLQARAALSNQSPGETARLIVRLALEQEESVELLNRIEALERRIHVIHTDLVTIGRGLLVTIGNVPVTEVDKWVSENLSHA